MQFTIGEQVNCEETRSVEFKEVKGQNPLGSIANTADEYAVAYLNSSGGKIFWGIRDTDRIVVGVELDRTRATLSGKPFVISSTRSSPQLTLLA